jgi:ice-binding like protein/collagen triple helix repeat protein
MTHQIIINWDPATNPNSMYNIRRRLVKAEANEMSVLLNAAPISSTSYTDMTVDFGQEYNYEVMSVSPDGSEVSLKMIMASALKEEENDTLALNFGEAASFGVLAGKSVANKPGTTTSVGGDVGTSPGIAIDGFDLPTSISGNYHHNDVLAISAQAAALSAFNAGNALPNANPLEQDLGSGTHFAGVYHTSGSLNIKGAVVLDAQGNPDATFVFQVGEALNTVSNSSSVVLQNSAQSDNVFWLVGGSATLGSNTSFAGNIIANDSISVSFNTSLNGRLIAMNGGITLDNDKLVIFQVGLLTMWAPKTKYSLGQIIFDGIGYEEVASAGTSGSNTPDWDRASGATTTDGSVVWAPISDVSDPPAGQAGLQGPQGPKGEDGPQGPQGAQGERGMQGTQGLPGVVGAAGERGPIGNMGQKGIAGARGETGVIGLQGAPGAKGKPGVAGNVGAQGIRGVGGATGLAGKNG